MVEQWSSVTVIPKQTRWQQSYVHGTIEEGEFKQMDKRCMTWPVVRFFCQSSSSFIHLNCFLQCVYCYRLSIQFTLFHLCSSVARFVSVLEVHLSSLRLFEGMCIGIWHVCPGKLPTSDCSVLLPISFAESMNASWIISNSMYSLARPEFLALVYFFFHVFYRPWYCLHCSLSIVAFVIIPFSSWYCMPFTARYVVVLVDDSPNICCACASNIFLKRMWLSSWATYS